MTNGTKGTKYEATKGLDIKVIAKLVRADIAAAVAGGELEAGTTASVRIQRYSCGRSITVEITVPGVARCSVEETEAGRTNGVNKPWLTRVAYGAEQTVQAILDAYNYDRSDAQSDYFDVRFYTHLSVVGAADLGQVA